jgi:hypothetical protein
VYARIVPGAELIVYEGAPHGLMYTERARFTGELAAIVESAGQQGLRRAML